LKVKEFSWRRGGIMSTIIVFGLSSSGLFLLREISKTDNVIIGVGRRNEIGLFSKFGIKYIVETEYDLRDIIGVILESCESKPKAFIGSGYYLTMIIERMPEIFDLVDFNGPDLQLLKVFNDKLLTYNLLEEYNISTLSAYQLTDINKIMAEEYPLILKWNSVELDSTKKIIKKTKVINNKFEIEKLFISNQNLSTKLILQRYIHGEAIEEYGYGGYYENGERRLEIIMKAIRQYPLGTYTFAEEVGDNDITNHIKTKLRYMLKEINYNGFIHFDIKIDTDTQKFYVIDANPRPWLSMKILKKKYPNFYMLFVGNFTDIEEAKVKVQWVNLHMDFISIISRAINSRSILSIITDYRKYSINRIIIDIVQLNDLMPILGLGKIAFIKLKEKVIKKFT
jgi:hypothetical protein